MKEDEIEQECQQLEQQRAELEEMYQQKSVAKTEAYESAIAQRIDLLDKTQKAFDNKQRNIDFQKGELAKKEAQFALRQGDYLSLCHQLEKEKTAFEQHKAQKDAELEAKACAVDKQQRLVNNDRAQLNAERIAAQEQMAQTAETQQKRNELLAAERENLDQKAAMIQQETFTTAGGAVVKKKRKAISEEDEKPVAAAAALDLKDDDEDVKVKDDPRIWEVKSMPQQVVEFDTDFNPCDKTSNDGDSAVTLPSPDKSADDKKSL